MKFKHWLENIYYRGSQGGEEFTWTSLAKSRGQQEGPGFYFTSSEQDAQRYVTDQGELYKVELNLKKTVPLEGTIPALQIKKLIQMAPNLEETLMDWDENPEKAFRDAYSSILNYTKNPHDAFQQVWYDFYHRYGADVDYLQNMVKLGYDGVLIQKADSVTHAVVFNPNSIKIKR